MNETDETYRLVESDAVGWLEQGRGALLSAEVVYAALTEIMPLSQTLQGIREKKLAYVQSFMLLTAIAFENLLKGIVVAVEPTGWRDLKADSGHGISTFAAMFTTLSEPERDLLLRLQEYLVWAGRYTIPTKSARYVTNFHLLSLRRGDRLLISALFERLAAILRSRLAQHA
jgi:hypothetical protein